MDKTIPELLSLLKKSESTPFLFIGTGLSRRYLNAPDWEGLLSHFAGQTGNGEFAYNLYENEAKKEQIDDLYPKIASLIEYDYNKVWYTTSKYEERRNKFRELIKSGYSPFKIEIGDYFLNCSNKKANFKEYSQELGLLGRIGEKSISGIITTNYDLLLENIFKDYIKYTGQEELLFSSIQGMGEIFKIHGCCEKPETIVLTESDYTNFNKKNAYLAAKLLTIFIEHPVIFLGYSVSDKNIEEILKSIVGCLSGKNLDILKDRLIFIKYKKGLEKPEVSTYSKSFIGTGSISMTRIEAKSFLPVYQTILEIKSKYKTSILRKLKEEIYELVISNDPANKLKALDITSDDSFSAVDTVLGVGIRSGFKEQGYSTMKAADLYRDVVFDNGDWDYKLLVKNTLPVLLKHNSNSLPIYKYIHGYDAKELPTSVNKVIKQGFNEFLSKTIRGNKSKIKEYENLTVKLLREKLQDDLKSVESAVFLSQENIDLVELHQLISDVFNVFPNILDDKGVQLNYRSGLRRLIKIYDWLKYFNK